MGKNKILNGLLAELVRENRLAGGVFFFLLPLI
jgi:hypothetical protein